MVKGWKHWCPNGCGKSVVYQWNKKFKCLRCDAEFNKKDIVRFKK